MVDSENSRLQVFSNDGRLRFVIGRKGALPHELHHPMGVCLSRDSEENILVTDSVNACVKAGILQNNIVSTIIHV